ncbi:MAG: phosphodiester glycosidase family protein, partial [Gammaproteobacteria bacterium]
TATCAATRWQNLANGLDYTNIPVNSTGGKIHAFKIDLKEYKLSLARAQDIGSKSANVITLAIQSGGIIAINGGFFDPFHTPLGLRIENGQLLNPIRPISWWGVFYILNNKHAYITSMKNFTLSPNIDFAIQSGPRLIVNGSTPTLKDDYAARSALCIDRQGNVIIAITESIAITPEVFAGLLRRPTTQNGLGCYNALNLDGGSSSQLYAVIGNFHLMIPSFSNVADAVVVVPRK